MSGTEFKQKFVAFVDVLGFKGMVQSAENGRGELLDQVLECLKQYGAPSYRKRFEQHGPMLCPQAEYKNRNLDFQLTQVSDCLVASSEVSPAGVINLMNHCWGLVIILMGYGVMCRGFITLGSIHHSADRLVGTGYQRAFEQEHQVSAFKQGAEERGTPFVEIDQSVCEYTKSCTNPCVAEMFSRMTLHDGRVVALYPFKRLAHSFVIGGFGLRFDPEKERRSNQNLRSSLIRMRDRVWELVDRSNHDAIMKAEHYIRALNTQLDICNQTDEAITKLTLPFPRQS